jgi:apolipoprotein N-acyltransferase
MSLIQPTKRVQRIPAPHSEVAKPELRSRSAWMLGPASGFLLFLAFPPADRPYLAWAALVPLLLLVRPKVSRLTAYLSAWLGGLVFWVSSLSWIRVLHPQAGLAWGALAIYQSVYWVLFIGLARLAHNRFRVPLIVSAPVAWVACEYIQAFALSGFPWYYLAHSQYRVLPLIQISDLVGAWGVSLVVMLFNAWLVVVIEQILRVREGSQPAIGRLAWPTMGVVVILASSLGYGAYRLSQTSFRTGPKVLLLQSNLKQEMKMGMDSAEIIGIFAQLVRSAYSQEAKAGVDLVVWPETSYPLGWVFVERDAGVAALEKAARQIQAESNLLGWLERQNEVRTELNAWSRELGCPMLVGVTYYGLEKAGGYKANGAVWIDGENETPKAYKKMHLVPFGEYIPFLEQIPWISRLAPYDDNRLPRLRAGRKPVWFDNNGLRYATAICFEDTLPHLVRRFFSEAPNGHQPDVLVNISNDGWFNGTAEHELHLAIGIYRSVENRVPLVRAANMGYTVVADGNGRILQELPKQTQSSLTGVVPLDPRTSLYSAVGDVLPQGCLVACLLVLIASWWPRRTEPLAA